MRVSREVAPAGAGVEFCGDPAGVKLEMSAPETFNTFAGHKRGLRVAPTYMDANASWDTPLDGLLRYR